MLRRLPYIILAVAIAVYFSAQGFSVSAASPIMYSGTVTWAVSRRGQTTGSDFNYSAFTEELPALRSAGLITDQLGGYPWNYSSETAFTNFPSWIAVKSKDLAQNGGYVYYAFAYAYKQHSSISNLSLNTGNVKSKIHSSGGIDNAMTNGATQTITCATTTTPNSYISENYSAVSVSDPIFERIVQNDGSSFATTAYFLSQANTDFLEHGVANTLVYNYSESSLNWIRTNLVYGRVTVDARNTQGNDWTTVWIDLRTLVSGSFASALLGTPYHFSDGTSGYANLRGGSILYMLPVYCYATSSQNYQEIEQYLADILSAVQNNNPNNVPQSVLESYAALGSEAREAAHAAASQMAQNYPTYDASAMDISNYVDPTAKAQFKSVVSFLGNRRIVPIIGVVFTLVLIGYVFFGKK